MVKLGTQEKKILRKAREYGKMMNTAKLPTPSFKQLVEKGCLVRVDHGKFEITEKGKEELQKRESDDDNGREGEA